jgi:hypothetical protein
VAVIDQLELVRALRERHAPRGAAAVETAP